MLFLLAAYGPSSTESFTLQYNGSKFINLNLTVTATAGTAYSFTSTDYDDVISALSADYPDQTANLANYGSIDRRDTSDNYWSDDMILEAINVVLPTATEGDIYDVSYTIYNGTTTTEVMTVKFESGSYVLNQTIAEVKTIVAKNSGDWEFPYVFSTDDYDLLGQSYGNFDSGSIYKLDIFLETLMPYAKAGDAMTVQYEYYDGSTNYRYSTSTFDGNKWNLVLDVIETSFQYGFEDGKWVPDNTINYIFLSADYDTVGASTELASDTDFTDALGNLNTYGNFNRNNGSTHWEDEMIVKAIAIVLNEINPNAADGQKYAVTISTYGASQTETFKLIKNQVFGKQTNKLIINYRFIKTTSFEVVFLFLKLVTLPR